MFLEFEQTEIAKAPFEKKFQPSIKNLVHFLRHEELWPSGFQWYYTDPETCAIGLCCQYWHISPSELHGMDIDAYYEIFLEGTITKKFLWFKYKTNRKWPDISPNDVAKSLEFVFNL
jgi:hypothetical protein